MGQLSERGKQPMQSFVGTKSKMVSKKVKRKQVLGSGFPSLHIYRNGWS